MVGDTDTPLKLGVRECQKQSNRNVVLQSKDRGGGEVRIHGIEAGMIVNSSRRVITIVVRRGGWRRRAERIFHNDDAARIEHVRTHVARD